MFVARASSALHSRHRFAASFLYRLPVIGYAMGLPKLSSDGQFFVGAQTAVSLYVPTQTAGRLSLIAACSAYTIIETGFFIFFF